MVSSTNLSATWADGLWEVKDSSTGRWYTSTGSQIDAHILNEKLTLISPSSPLGIKIRVAVKRKELEQEDA